MKIPVRYRLTLFFSTLFGVMLLISLAIVYLRVTHSLHKDFHTEMIHDGRIVAELFKEELKLGDLDELEKEVVEFGIDILVLDQDKHVVVQSTDWAKIGVVIDEATLQQIKTAPVFEELNIEGRHWALFSRIVNIPGNGQYSLHMLRSEQSLVRTREKLLMWMFIIAPVVLLFSALAGFLFSRRTLIAEQRAFERLQRFTSDASHELRIPLTSLRGNLEVAIRKERTPAEYKEAISIALQEAEHLSKLTQDLLLLAQMDSGQLKLNIQNVPLHAFFSDALAHLNALPNEKGIQIEVLPLPDGAAPFDPDRVRQLLFNLVENAMKYGNAGGHVRIGVSKDSNSLKIIVRDDGIGIPVSAQEKIFDRFYRIDTARSRDEGGVGLGLSIVRWVVDAHAGKIDVASIEGQGTVFTIRLPLQAVEA